MQAEQRLFSFLLNERILTGGFCQHWGHKQLSHLLDSQLPSKIPQWDCRSSIHNVISRVPRLNSKLVDFARCECMKLGTTATEIIVIESQFIIFNVWDTIIYKVSDKLSDFESCELYDMLWRFTPYTHWKRAARGALTAKKSAAAFIIIIIII